jgi:ubiquitin carboxyl-terminal hydrolase L3
MSEIKHWIPLESNPEVLSSFAHRIGVLNIPDSYKFHDIFGLDDEMLAFIPTPVVAVILLFPIDNSNEKRRGEVLTF